MTGGAGFIGSHLVGRLLADGHEVTAVDDLSTGDQNNLKGSMERPGFEFVNGDFASERVLSKALPGADAVVHLAAIVGVPRSISEPELVHEVNVNRTLRLLSACAKNGVGRFVFASSGSVYGDASPPVAESLPPSPLSPYAASKAACEAYCMAYQSAYGISTVVLRFMNVYGPRMGSTYGAVMTEFARAVHEGTPLTVYGDGGQTRDFVHVSDVAEAVSLGVTADRARGRTFNVGTGVPTSIAELADMFISSSGVKGLGVSNLKPRVGDIVHSYADVSRARRELGFDPKTRLQDGVRELLEWYPQGAKPKGG